MAAHSRSPVAPPFTATDPRVYQRATTAALAGLTIQIALVLLMGLTALWSGSPAIYSAGWHMLGGLPIWIVLALLYHQHPCLGQIALEAREKGLELPPALGLGGRAEWNDDVEDCTWSRHRM